MNQRASDDFASDYALLRAPYGCDLAELKRCYRLAVRALHPDRNPDLAADQASQDALQELTSAYRRLTQHARDFGRLPAARRPTPAPRAKSPVPAVPPRRRSWGHKAFMLAAAVTAVAVMAWPDPESVGPPVEAVLDTTLAGDAGSAASLRPMEPAGTVRAPEVAQRANIRIGDSKRKVRALLGAPMLSTATLWEYGPSHVLFEDGHVIDWYSSPLQPIRVDEASRK